MFVGSITFSSPSAELSASVSPEGHVVASTAPEGTLDVVTVVGELQSVSPAQATIEVE
jgi:hypothetical protein